MFQFDEHFFKINDFLNINEQIFSCDEHLLYFMNNCGLQFTNF